MPVDQIAEPTHKLIDVREVARRLGCSWRSVYRLHDSGRMPAGVKVGSLRRWDAAQIDVFIIAGCKMPKSAKVRS